MAYKALQTWIQSGFSSVFKSISRRNRSCCVRVLLSALYIVPQGHGGSRMSCCCLRLLDIFGHVVQVCENCGAKAAWRYGYFKFSVAPDPLAHSAHLGIGKRVCSTKYKVFWFTLRQKRNDLSNKINGTAASFGFGVFYKRLIARWILNQGDAKL